MRPHRLIADRYRLVEPLSGSSTGDHWRVQDQWSGQPVVLTRVPMFGLAGQELLGARHEIATEVRALGVVHHDRIARPLDVMVDSDDLWVASEPLPGVTMSDELGRRGAVGPEEAARWGRDVADGLAAAHGSGVIHRNLHAGLMGLAEDGRAVVGGFATTVVTQDSLQNGTPIHVAPEVARGGKPSQASDVFALGAMLYTAVEGRGLFPAAADAVAAPQRAGRLGELLMQMLHSDPAQRPTAAVVADRLRLLPAVPGTANWTTTGPEPGHPVGVAPAPVSAGLPSFRPPLPWVPPPMGPDPAGLPGPGLPLATTGPAPIWQRRMWWVAAVAVVAVLALTGGLVFAFRPASTSGLPGQPISAPATPPSPIGDPRTADPCSLLNVGSVQRFGQATMFGDTGYPQSCLINIETGGELYVKLWATFSAPENQAPYGVAEQRGDLMIYQAVSDGECRRTVVLGDRSWVYVQVFADQGATTDLCAVADAGTQTAVLALSGGSLPRREVSGPPNALTALDTCSLLDQAALGQVPGLEAARRDRGFAGWLCTWGDNPAFSGDSWVLVAVDRLASLDGEPVQIAGRSAQVTPGDSDNPGSCNVNLVQRSYTGASGEARVEFLRLRVVLGAQQSADAACGFAKALAAAAAPKLPSV